MRNNEDRFGSAASPPQPVAEGLHYVVPTELVELPSKGLFYPENHPLHDKEFVEIKHMTTKEEDILTSTALIEKGVVLEYLVNSLLINKQIQANSLLPGDQNAILISARISAYGSEYGFSDKCPACGNLNKIEYDLESLKTKELTYNEDFVNGLISIRLEKTNFQIKLKQLNIADISRIEKENNRRSKMGVPMGDNMLLLSSIIYSINGEKNDGSLKFLNVIENLPSKDVRQIKLSYNKTKPDVDLTINIQCNSCGHVKEGRLPITARFFWPDA
jgi:hypothetical protein|tara:strand:+ start:2024 stop:2845 length:822 start_codon:yes stop_codon:yes gene_type:complete